ncbi:MAG: DUF4328 domain-containing protein [Betaproteobacteria bacterium]
MIVVSLIAVISGMLEHRLLTRLTDGAFASQAEATAAAHASDALQAVVASVQVITFLASGIVLLMWIYRANFNARALGAATMQFTPGWSVGWYFVPFVNLWKPHQAMREIWQASANPHNWRDESVPSLLGWWWFLWIVSNILGNASFRMSLAAKAISAMLAANIVTLIADIVETPLCVIVLLLVSRIYKMQMAEAAPRV